MKIEINKRFVQSDDTIGNYIIITPPIDENYWILRVQLSDRQALVCFPKFNTLGIGFQHEEDWNTNLPYTKNAAMIYDHIAHNKGDDTITRAQCIEAINMLKDAAAQLMRK